VDDDENILIADCWNHRIVEWKCDATSGQVVAGGNGYGSRTDQLNFPTDVVFDKKTDSLIVCDRGNRRVMQWFRRNRTSGKTIIENINCFGLKMDSERFLYVTDCQKHEVRKYRVDETDGTVVARVNEQCQRFEQSNGPMYIFVDIDQSLYVSDPNTRRVLKWNKGAKEENIVAGGKDQDQGNDLAQFFYPKGVVVDPLGTVYVTDSLNHRVMSYCNRETLGRVIIGGNGRGDQADQLNYPSSLSFDRHGNLYVVDRGNHRVQRFKIKVLTSQ